jgi:hypothetical protein
MGLLKGQLAKLDFEFYSPFGTKMTNRSNSNLAASFEFFVHG